MTAFGRLGNRCRRHYRLTQTSTSCPSAFVSEPSPIPSGESSTSCPKNSASRSQLPVVFHPVSGIRAPFSRTFNTPKHGGKYNVENFDDATSGSPLPGFLPGGEVSCFVPLCHKLRQGLGRHYRMMKQAIWVVGAIVTVVGASALIFFVNSWSSSM